MREWNKIPETREPEQEHQEEITSSCLMHPCLTTYILCKNSKNKTHQCNGNQQTPPMTIYFRDIVDTSFDRISQFQYWVNDGAGLHPWKTNGCRTDWLTVLGTVFDCIWLDLIAFDCIWLHLVVFGCSYCWLYLVLSKTWMHRKDAAGLHLCNIRDRRTKPAGCTFALFSMLS